ncbi:hypothetical protein M422DRAFT_248065 [Sphaerobolus stellatus SS14]|nr:hypothetical protein M422DRAFT_248065 [Sphaerobolus stellatus SS14]
MPALCRTSSLVEELSQIEYVFSDKTGTLTQMIDESKVEDAPGASGMFNALWTLLVPSMSTNTFDDPSSSASNMEQEREVTREFMTFLAVCHTVIPEVKDGGQIKYQASSPDEAALVSDAEMLGYKSVYIDIYSQTAEYEILNACKFNSRRNACPPDGRIKLFCKGADMAILERLALNQPYTEKMLQQLENYATEGLHTLYSASRTIPEAEYLAWAEIYNAASTTISRRGEALDKAAEMIETRYVPSWIKNQCKLGDVEDLVLIIDGKSLGFALEKELSEQFLELAVLCKAVVVSRHSRRKAREEELQVDLAEYKRW